MELQVMLQVHVFPSRFYDLLLLGTSVLPGFRAMLGIYGHLGGGVLVDAVGGGQATGVGSHEGGELDCVLGGWL